MDSELTYKIALSMTEGMSVEMVNILEDRHVSPEEFFHLSMPELGERIGMRIHIPDMVRQEALFRARQEETFVTRQRIRALFITDEGYPVLLREIPDAPLMIYVRGEADLNPRHSFSVVGTRRCTSYGTNFSRQLVNDMAVYFPEAVVVSGLAYGIDATAHTAALEAGLPTFAVLAHGLDRVYPAAHRDLAHKIIDKGGALISEYPSGVRPFQRNFLERNRIVAGLCELTVVAESEVRGGAMSTANYAFHYSREVVALPGRASDLSSSGCNMLIARNKAHIYTTMAELLKIVGWEIPVIGKSANVLQTSLFPELEPPASDIVRFLHKEACPKSIDEIHAATHTPMPQLMSTLGELEFDGLISRLPGARYELT